jgi:HAD superfamily hydrolase (TIGR01509 family)
MSYNPCVTSLSARTNPALAAVIFDIGGTLVYPTTGDEDCIRRLTAWLVQQGWPEDAHAAVEEARRWVFETTAQTGRQCTMQEGIRRALGERVFFEPEMAGYRPFPDAVRLLHRLTRAGLMVGCISNATSHWLIEQIVDQMGFRPFVDPVVSSAGFGRTKPDPSIFESVLKGWDVPAERTAMVGDTLAADIAGGRGAGMRTLYVTMRPNPDNVNHPHVRADAEASSLVEAERILLAWADAAGSIAVP